MQARVQWSLLWRSAVWIPLGVLVAFAVIGFPLQIVAICAWSAVLCSQGHWCCGVLLLGLIAPVLLVRRWLGRCLCRGGIAG